MKGYRGSAAIGVPELLMRSSLPNFDEPQRDQDFYDLARLQDWYRHGLAHMHGFRPHEHGL